MKPGTLTPAMTRALVALARYHYLMPRQFTRLPGFPANPEGVHKLLRRFPAEKGEIDCIRAGVDRENKAGRVPRLYYLTKHGAAAVAELNQSDPETIFYPKGDKLPLQDVQHRAMCIDFWIELNAFAAATESAVEFFHPYFRTVGHNRNADPATRLKKLTRIDFPPEVARKHSKPFFWPDGVFVLRTPGERILYLLECYRGIDTGRVIRQLEWHLLALEHGLPSLRYGFDTANRVLLVFQTEEALHAVLKRLLTRPGFDDFAAFIACSTLARLQGNFQDWWYVWQGNVTAGRLY
jgi:hypothetical protein